MASEMRLAGICKDCIKRLGVDERLTIPINFVNMSKLPQYNEKSLEGVQFPATSKAFGLGRGHAGATKITYKVAKTVKESIDEHGSGTSKLSHHGSKSNNSGKKH